MAVSSVAPFIDLLTGVVSPIAREVAIAPLPNKNIPDTTEAIRGLLQRPIDFDQPAIGLGSGSMRALSGQGGVGLLSKTKATTPIYDEATAALETGGPVRPAILGNKQGTDLRLFIPVNEFSVPEEVAKRGGYSWLNPSEAQAFVGNLQEYAKSRDAQSLGFNPMGLIKEFRDDGSIRLDLGAVSNFLQSNLLKRGRNKEWVEDAPSLWDITRKVGLAGKVDELTNSPFNRNRGTNFLGGLSFNVDDRGRVLVPRYEGNKRYFVPVTNEEQPLIYIAGRPSPDSKLPVRISRDGDYVDNAGAIVDRFGNVIKEPPASNRVAAMGGTATKPTVGRELQEETDGAGFMTAIRASVNSQGQQPKPYSVKQTVQALGDKRDLANERFELQDVGDQLVIDPYAFRTEVPSRTASELSQQKFELGDSTVPLEDAYNIVNALRSGVIGGVTKGLRRNAPDLQTAKSIAASNFDDQKINIPTLGWQDGDNVRRVAFATQVNPSTGYKELIAVQNIGGKVATAPARFGFSSRNNAVVPTVTVGNQVLDLGEDQVRQLGIDLGLGSGKENGVAVEDDLLGSMFRLATQPLPDLNDPNAPQVVNLQGLYKYDNDDMFNWVAKNFDNNFARALNYGDISLPAATESADYAKALARGKKVRVPIDLGDTPVEEAQALLADQIARGKVVVENPANVGNVPGTGTSNASPSFYQVQYEPLPRDDVRDALRLPRLTESQSIVLNPLLYANAQSPADIDELELLQNISNSNVLAGESISVPRTVIIPNESNAQVAVQRVAQLLGQSNFSQISDDSGNAIAYYFGEQPSVVRELPNFEGRDPRFVTEPERVSALIKNRIGSRFSRTGEVQLPGNVLVSPQRFAENVAYEDELSPLNVDLVGPKAGRTSVTHTDKGLELDSSFLSERERTYRNLLMGAGLRRTLFPDEFYGPNAVVAPEVNDLIDEVVYRSGSLDTDQQAMLERFVSDQQLGFDMVGEATEDNGRRFTDFILQRYVNAAEQGVTPEDIIKEVKRNLSQPTDTPELLQTGKVLDQITQELAGQDDLDPIDELLRRGLEAGIDSDSPESVIIQRALRQVGYDDLARREIEMGNLPVSRSYNVSQGGGARTEKPVSSIGKVISILPSTGEAQDWRRWQPLPAQEEGRVIAMRANASTPEELTQPMGQWVSIPNTEPRATSPLDRTARAVATQRQLDNSVDENINLVDYLRQSIIEEDKANYWRGRANQEAPNIVPVRAYRTPVVDTYYAPGYAPGTNPVERQYIRLNNVLRPVVSTEGEYITVPGVPTDVNAPLSRAEIEAANAADIAAMIQRGEDPNSIQVVDGEVVDANPRQPTEFMSEDDYRYLYEMGYGDNRFNNSGERVIGMQPDTVLPPTRSVYDSSNRVRLIQDAAPTKEEAIRLLQELGVQYDPNNPFPNFDVAIRNLLAKGFSPEQITQTTGLSKRWLIENGYVEAPNNSLQPAVQQLQQRINNNQVTADSVIPGTIPNTVAPQPVIITNNPPARNIRTTNTSTGGVDGDGNVTAVRTGESQVGDYIPQFLRNPFAIAGVLGGLGVGAVTLDMIRNARSEEEQQYLMNQYLMQQQMMGYGQPVYAMR